MGVELRPNDNAREGRASVWIFSGRSIVYLVVGVAMGIFDLDFLRAVDRLSGGGCRHGDRSVPAGQYGVGL